MPVFTRAACLLVCASLLIATAAPAVQLSDGRSYFVQMPRLVSTSAYNRFINQRSELYFAIALPAGAGEPLARIDIEMGEYGYDYYLDLGRSRVFDAERPERRFAIAQSAIRPEPTQPRVVLALAEPVPPGTTVVVALRVSLGPRIGGTHLYGITAYPPGEKPHGQFLGYGRLRIDDN